MAANSVRTKGAKASRLETERKQTHQRALKIASELALRAPPKIDDSDAFSSDDQAAEPAHVLDLHHGVGQLAEPRAQRADPAPGAEQSDQVWRGALPERLRLTPPKDDACARRVGALL